MPWQFIHEGNSLRIGDKVYELPKSREVFMLMDTPYEIYSEMQAVDDGYRPGFRIIYGIRRLKQREKDSEIPDERNF